jgi:hypothetical protein
LDTGSLIDGRIYCRVERNDFNVEVMEFDLLNTKHYLLMASGTETSEDTVGLHTSQDWSRNPYNLTRPGIVRPDNSRRILVTVHGALMVSCVLWRQDLHVFVLDRRVDRIDFNRHRHQPVLQEHLGE